MTRRWTRSADRGGLDPHRPVGRRPRQRVGDHVGQRPLEQRRIGVDRAAASRARRRSTLVGSWSSELSAVGDHVLEVDGPASDADGAGLEPAHVEQVADEPVEPVGLLVDGLGELAALLGVPRPRRTGSRLVADALIDASGVRRSCDTACEERGAQRVGLGQAGRRRPPRPAAGATRAASDEAATGRCAARAGRRPTSCGAAQRRARSVPSAARSQRSPSNGSVGGSAPALASTTHPSSRLDSRDDAPRARRSVRSWSSSSGSGSGSPIRMPLARASAPASARARSASRLRRATRSTRTLATGGHGHEDDEGDDVLGVGDREACGSAARRTS